MAEFFMRRVGAPAATPLQLAEASDHDRLVIFIWITTPSTTRVAFTETDVTSGSTSIPINSATPWEPRFVIPAGHELWAYADLDPIDIGFMVTKAEVAAG